MSNRPSSTMPGNAAIGLSRTFKLTSGHSPLNARTCFCSKPEYTAEATYPSSIWPMSPRPARWGIALGKFELTHRRLSLDHQRRTGFGQADFTLLTQEQPGAQFLFHVLNLSAQGRRRNTQLFGCTGEIAQTGDG